MRTIGGTLGCWIAYSQLQLSNSARPKGMVRLEQTRHRARLPISRLDCGPASASLPGVALSIKGQIAKRRSLVAIERQTSRGLLRQIQVRWQVAESLFQCPVKGMLLSGLGRHESLPVELETVNTPTALISLSGYRYLPGGIDFAFIGQLKAMFRQMAGMMSKVTA